MQGGAAAQRVVPGAPLFFINLSRTWPRVHYGPLKFLSAG